MGNRKQYTSVSKVLRDIAPDDTFRGEFDERVAGRKLIKQLLALRAVKGLSQTEIAEKLGCKQSRVSKLENANDADLRLGDLRAYSDAVGCELIVQPMPRGVRAADKVKLHVCAIKKHMDDLAELARSDKQVAQGVAEFFGEVLFNTVLMLGDSARRLPLRPDESPYFEVQIRQSSSTEEKSLPDCCSELEGISHIARCAER